MSAQKRPGKQTRHFLIIRDSTSDSRITVRRIFLVFQKSGFGQWDVLQYERNPVMVRTGCYQVVNFLNLLAYVTTS